MTSIHSIGQRMRCSRCHGARQCIDNTDHKSFIKGTQKSFGFELQTGQRTSIHSMCCVIWNTFAANMISNNMLFRTSLTVQLSQSVSLFCFFAYGLQTWTSSWSSESEFQFVDKKTLNYSLFESSSSLCCVLLPRTDLSSFPWSPFRRCQS